MQIKTSFVKRYLLPYLFCLAHFQAQSQLGVTASTTVNSLPDWQVVVENYVVHRHIDFLQHGTTGAVDYLLPDQSEAWRFSPALLASRATVTYSPNEIPHHFEAFALGIQFDVGFNPFAHVKPFNKDREPPYFTGIFITASPGLCLVRTVYDAPILNGDTFEDEFRRYADHRFTFNIGGGLLCEFQLSEFLSLAPVLGVRFFPALNWRNFTNIVSEGSMTGTFDQTTWRQYSIGLRMGLQLKK